MPATRTDLLLIADPMDVSKLTCGVPVVPAVVMIVCFCVGLYVAWEVLFSPLRAFPGPFVARFTNLWRTFFTRRGRVDTDMRHWHQKWGPAVRVGPNTISLSDPDLIKVVYASTARTAWRKGDMYRVNDVVVDNKRVTNIFNTQDDAFHARNTKPIGGFWTLSKILDLEPLMDETITAFADKLGTTFADASDSKRNICRMDDWLAFFSWDASAQICFGSHYGFIDKGQDVNDMIADSSASLRYFATLTQIPWLDKWLDKNPFMRFGPRPLVHGFNYTVKLVSNYQQRLVADYQKTPVANDHKTLVTNDQKTPMATDQKKVRRTFIDRYFGLKDAYDFVDDDQIISWLMLIILAGGDSKAGALRPIVYYLAKNPKAQDHLQRELDAVYLSTPPQWREIRYMTFLDAVIREASRLSPAVGLMLEREVPPGGFQLADGRYLPGGTNVGINPAVVTRDADVFGDCADSFSPERWMRRNHETLGAYHRRRRRMEDVTDLMFGAGTRTCMGKHLAKVEMYKLTAALYKSFHINLGDVEHEWKPFNAWFMYQTDMPMTIRRRQGN